MSRKIVNKGDRYNKLTIIKELKQHIQPCGNKKRMFKCLCDCGNKTKTLLSHLTTGHTRSCGCLKIENNGMRTHGITGTKIYYTWQSIKDRCDNKNNNSYKNYGGRGIKYCNTWKSFEIFYEDMINEYNEHIRIHGDKDTTIERKITNWGYSKENCTWATYKEQSRNKRNNILFSHNGKNKILKDICKDLNINYHTTESRIRILGQDFNEAIKFNKNKVGNICEVKLD